MSNLDPLIVLGTLFWPLIFTFLVTEYLTLKMFHTARLMLYENSIGIINTTTTNLDFKSKRNTELKAVLKGQEKYKLQLLFAQIL